MEGNHAPMRLLMLIATPRLSGKAEAMMDEARMPVQYRLSGHGTASREVLDMLGLDSGDKNILLSLLPKPLADDVLDALRRRGHELNIVSGGQYGRGQMILRDGDSWVGATEPRADGSVIGF